MEHRRREGPLADLRVIDCSTVIAGPGCARHLGDFGADVIKVERPGSPDSTRNMGWRDPSDDVTLWWKLIGRNKRCVEFDFKDPVDHRRMRELVRSADVLVENFRPGTHERLDLAPEDLIADNPKLVVVRITGFGQDGPYAAKPGFATLAEALSGFAAINGEPDGGPLLPPIALTDEIAALAAAYATMVAVHSGTGQVVDVNLLDALAQFMGPLAAASKLLGYQQPRLGSGIPYSVPRGTYRCRDGKWVAVSASADSVAQRVLALIGLDNREHLSTFEGRSTHRAEVDTALTEWIGHRSLAEVLAAFDDAEAAAAPVYEMADYLADPHVRSRGSVVEIEGVPMFEPIARLSETPGRIRWAGRPVGADSAEISEELDERGS